MLITGTSPASGFTQIAVNVTLSGAVPITGFVGEQYQLTATAYDSRGNVVASPSVAWSVDNPAIASVSSSGLVTVKGVGSGNVLAVVDGRLYTTPVTASLGLVGDYDQLIPATTSMSHIAFRSTRFNVTQGSGKVSRWDDARGQAFGIPLVQAASANQPFISGTLITTDGVATYLATALSASYDQSQTCVGMWAVMELDDDNAAVSNSFPITMGPASNSPGLHFADGQGFVNPAGDICAFAQPGGNVVPSPSNSFSSAVQPIGRTKIPKRTLVMAWRTASQVSICIPPAPPVTLSTTAATAGNAALRIGTEGGVTLFSKVRISAIGEFTCPTTAGPSAADRSRFMQWAVTHEGALNDAPTMVIYVGDSQTFGTTLTRRNANFASLAMQQQSQMAWADVNLGIQSKTLQEMNADAQTFLLPYASASRTKTLWVILGGTNDMAGVNGYLNGTDTKAQLKTLCQTIRAFPGTNTIVVADCLPRVSGLTGTTTQFETDRQTFISLIAADPTFYDKRIAWGNDAIFGQQANASDVTKYSDGIHATAVIHALQQLYVTQALNA